MTSNVLQAATLTWHLLAPHVRIDLKRRKPATRHVRRARFIHYVAEEEERLRAGKITRTRHALRVVRECGTRTVRQQERALR